MIVHIWLYLAEIVITREPENSWNIVIWDHLGMISFPHHHSSPPVARRQSWPPPFRAQSVANWRSTPDMILFQSPLCQTGARIRIEENLLSTTCTTCPFLPTLGTGKWSNKTNQLGAELRSANHTWRWLGTLTWCSNGKIIYLTNCFFPANHVKLPKHTCHHNQLF